MLLKLSPIFVNISLLQSLCSLYDLLLLFITVRYSFENTLVFWVLLVGEWEWEICNKWSAWYFGNFCVFLTGYYFVLLWEVWRRLLIWTSSFLYTVVQTGALRWVQVCLHGSDQELPGRVRGGEEDQPRRCGGCNESVGEGSNGKHSLAQFINQLFIWVFKSKTYSLHFVAQNWGQTVVWLELE